MKWDGKEQKIDTFQLEMILEFLKSSIAAFLAVQFLAVNTSFHRNTFQSNTLIIAIYISWGRKVILTPIFVSIEKRKTAISLNNTEVVIYS